MDLKAKTKYVYNTELQYDSYSRRKRFDCDSWIEEGPSSFSLKILTFSLTPKQIKRILREKR